MTNDDACRPGGVTPGNNNNKTWVLKLLLYQCLILPVNLMYFLIFDYTTIKIIGGDANVEVSNDGGVSFTDISGPLPNLEAWQQGIFGLSDYNDQDSIIDSYGVMQEVGQQV